MVFVTIVLDGVGIGAQPDADRYGDADSHTLGHVCQAAHPALPHLARLGLGHITPLAGIPLEEKPLACYGRMQEVSAGKDSTTGHWELAGLRLDQPFPTYPEGFPPELIDAFVQRTGCGDVLGNIPASGTEIIARLGARHQETGYPIVYTSADSVFQVAAHTDVIPVEELYRICRIARDEICVGEHAVGRVIARPFSGRPGAYARVSAKRKDYSMTPPGMPVQEALRQHGVRTVSVGKVASLFGDVGFDESIPAKSNGECIMAILRLLNNFTAEREPTFIWANLVDFDQEYGHRNDVQGFARSLEAFDRALPDLLDVLPGNGHLVITADHGNDPTTPGTDHSREYVPLLVYRGWEVTEAGQDLGLRTSFCDHAATVAACFDVPFAIEGTPFF